MHTQHAEIERVVAVEGALPHQRIGDGCLKPAHKFLQLLLRIGNDSAAADEDHGLFGSVNQICCGLQIFLMDCTDPRNDRLAFLRRKFTLLCCRVLRDIHENRTRTAILRDKEGPPDCLRQIPHILHNEIVLCDRHRDALDVDLLEGILAKKTDADIAGDRNNRDRVHVGCRNARDKICGAGSGCREADTDLPARPCISVRRMSSSLLM